MQRALVCLLAWTPIALAAQTTPQSALSLALRGTAATGIAMDVHSGRRVAAVGAVTRSSAPGSVLKPLFLAAALEQREVQPQTAVFCRRNLSIRTGAREWNLACTHPQSQTAFTAQDALAYSCNRYFAALADRIPPQQAVVTLTRYGLPLLPTPRSPEENQLLVLGVAGVLVSPEQMANAYRRLSLQLDLAGASSPLDAVRKGIADSVSYGMAHNAAVKGITISGKTGTASDPGESWSHGWFAGTGYLKREEVVLAIYLPHGNGADAARLAQHFFLALSDAP